jgi:hypothetical protein
MQRASSPEELDRDDNRPLHIDDSRVMNDLRVAPEDAVRLGGGGILQVVAIGLAQAVIIVATSLLVRAAIDTLAESG